MNKKILGLVLLAMLVAIPGAVFAQNTGGAGSTVTATSATTIATNVETLVTTIATSIVIIGWVIAGALYLFAQGSAEKIKTARAAMIAALIGTVLIILGKSTYATLSGIISSIFNSGT